VLEFPDIMKHFIIVGTQRTGSSAYAELMNMHPDIACGWEWFQKEYFSDKPGLAESALNGDFSRLPDRERQHIEGLLRKKPAWIGYRRLFRASNKWLFSPRLSPALWVDQFARHLGWISSRQDIAVIHIVRRDNIAWLCSKYLASLTNSYVGKAYPEDLKVRISIREAIKRVISKDWVDTRLAALSVTNPYVRVYYEDFLRHQDNALEAGLQLLDCDKTDMEKEQGEIKRQATKGPEDYIGNYEALRQALEQAGRLSTSVE